MASSTDFRDVLGERKTNVEGTANRLNNVTLAAKAVNGYVVNPNKEFSFNTVVGRRTTEKGYKSAPAFSNGKVIEAIGGGVCQVSSTIYASIKDKKGFKITERWPHSLPVSYLPAGWDATVNYGTADFRFVNNTGYPIRIDAVVANRVLSVQVRGTLAGSVPVTPPVVVTPGVPCIPTSAAVYVNGAKVAFDGYNIGGNNFFRIRDLAYTFNGTQKRFAVAYQGETNTVILTAGQPYIPIGGEMAGQGSAKSALPTNDKILLDGELIVMTAYKISGSNYFKLRDLGLAMNFGVEWDQAKWSIYIDTGKEYTPEGQNKDV